MFFRMIRWALLGAVAGLILGGVALGLSVMNETAGGPQGANRLPPYVAAAPGHGGGSVDAFDYEAGYMVEDVAKPYVREGNIDRALAIFDEVGSDDLKDRSLKWLAVALAIPARLETRGSFASLAGLTSPTGRAKPAPVEKESPVDFDKALAVAEMIKSPAVRASALVEIGNAQRRQSGPDHAQRAEATHGRALAAIREHYAPASDIRIGPIAIKPLPRVILWPAGAAVVGLVLGVVGVPIVGAYGDAVGRSLAKEIGAARRPAP